MVTASVALQIVLGTALALFFDLNLRGAWIVRGILLLPMLITPIVVGVMWRALLNPDWGLVDWAIRALGLTPPDWLGSVGMAMATLILVDTWQWAPFVFMIVFSRLQVLPREVFEAAEVDGAGYFVTLRRITIPMLMPAIVFAAVFRAVDAFRSFDLIYGYAAAAAYAMLLIIAVLTTFLLRFVQLRREDEL